MNLEEKITLAVILVIALAAYLAPPTVSFENQTKQVLYLDLVKDQIKTVDCKIIETKSMFAPRNSKYRIHKTQLKFDCPFSTNPVVIVSGSAEIKVPDISKESTQITYLENTNCAIKLTGAVEYDFPINKSYKELLSSLEKQYPLKKEFYTTQSKGFLYLSHELLLKSHAECDEFKKL